MTGRSQPAAESAVSPGYVHDFAEAAGMGAEVLGGKGAGLAHMTRLGLPVPPGFTVTCIAAREFRSQGEIPAAALEGIAAQIAALEQRMERRLGDPQAPLLVSVRSGAPVSMPGMMDTVLNVGLNPATVAGLAGETGDEGFAWACYRRFAEAYARLVRGIGAAQVAECQLDAEAGDERAATQALLDLVVEAGGGPVPDDPRAQVIECVEAVFRSWDSARAKAYRKFRGIDDDLCSAATVQAMVFGNRGEDSATGVVFSRDPSTGAAQPFGDVLFDAQGEEVVSGERDAEPLDALRRRLPGAAERLDRALAIVEGEARDLCEVEFTVEQGEFWVLQTRVGQRSGRAAVRIAVALAEDGAIDEREAIGRVTPAQIEAAAAPRFEPAPDDAVIARGLAASPGAASGAAVFDASRAATLAEQGEDVVLLRPTTSPADVAGFIAARAVVTGRGGRTSHAAVVARGMHRPAVCGVGELRVAADGRSAVLNGTELDEGERVSVDGDRGLLIRGTAPLVREPDDEALRRFLGWCESRSRAALLSDAELAGLPRAADLEELSASDAAVLLELDDPKRVTPQDLAAALPAHEGPPPVLRFGAEWLRGADVHLRGSVAGISAPASSPSRLLLAALLGAGGNGGER